MLEDGRDPIQPTREDGEYDDREYIRGCDRRPSPEPLEDSKARPCSQQPKEDGKHKGKNQHARHSGSDQAGSLRCALEDQILYGTPLHKRFSKIQLCRASEECHISPVERLIKTGPEAKLRQCFWRGALAQHQARRVPRKRVHAQKGNADNDPHRRYQEGCSSAQASHRNYLTRIPERQRESPSKLAAPCL